MTSRQRMIAALSHQSPDYVPCSFMLFNGLKSTCKDYEEFIEKQIALGLDPYVQIPARPPVVVNDWYNLHGLPVHFDAAVQTNEWVENRDNERWPMLVKEYHTPAGTLRAEVKKDETWRWGNHVPFFDDYLESRSIKFILTGEEDLDAIQFLLPAPTPQEIQDFKEEAKPAIALAKKHDLLLAGGWGIGVDSLAWLYGLKNMMFASYDKPEFLKTILEMVAKWNRARMQVILDAGIDLYIKRAWYENCDFWSPKTYRKFVEPILREDAKLAHKNGVKFGFIVSSNCMPLLEIYADAGVDTLIGVDPRGWDMAAAKRKIGNKVCLWGGINGHLTMEMDSPQNVQAEAETAFKVLAPGGGFILSPVDNVREWTPTAEQNTKALIDSWKKLRAA
ncbi:MAG: uroporphyrinogen decarboxylase family protein [Anaerolineaceae bacterium]|nr:uroporphyrinogen decarboxylase family protein [Anaerolineaceae bacterium]